MYQIFLIHSYVERHLACFQFLATMTRVAMNMVENMSLWWDEMPKNSRAGFWSRSIPNFLGSHYTEFHSGFTSLWLTTPISFAPTLPQHILEAGQIVGLRYCGWVDVTVPPLEALLSYRRGPVQAPYPLLLRVFSQVTFVDSREFPLHCVYFAPKFQRLS